jgi:glycosidase
VTLQPATGAGTLTLRNDALAVAFDAATGDLVSCVDLRSGDELLRHPGCSVPVDPGSGPTLERDHIGLVQRDGEGEAVGDPLAGAPERRLVASAQASTADGQTLSLSIESGELAWTVDYTVAADAPILGRRLRVRAAGDSTPVLRGAVYRSAFLAPGDDVEVIFPGNVPFAYRRLDDVPDGRPLLPVGVGGYVAQHGQAVLWSQRAARGVATWFHSDDEYTSFSLIPNGGAVAASHTLHVATPLPPGREQVLGTQFLWIAHGTRDDALRSFRPVHERVGLRAPERPLRDLGRRVIYCGHPGGLPEQYFTGFGGFTAMAAYVPRLAEMGVDVFWLMPVFEHGGGATHNLYSPYDHVSVDAIYGSNGELDAMARAMKGAGIDIILDVVPHGPPEESHQAAEHPEWQCRNEDGSPVLKWNSLAFDNGNPGWQRLMADEVASWVDRIGMAGIRIDVAGGSPPNWDPATGKRPTQATLGAGLGMMRALREGILARRDDVLLLPEEANGPDTFYRHADITYDFQLLFTFYELERRRATAEQWAQTLRTLLHDQALTLPEGALKMRFTATHDTTFHLGLSRPMDIFGAPRARALLALCILAEGVPMIFTGEEDPQLYRRLPPAERIRNHPKLQPFREEWAEQFPKLDPDMEAAPSDDDSKVAFIGSLTRLRHELPAMAGGADYASVRAGGGVLSFTRRAGDAVAVVLISFADSATTSTVSLPQSLAAVSRWRDELSGDTLRGGAEVKATMQGHGVRVLVPAE